MRAYGNGSAQQCAFNLLSTIRGECPYERCKGLSAEISDLPMTGAFGEIVTEASWNLRYYEPRVKPQDINLVMQDFLTAKFRIATTFTTEG